MEGEGPEVVVRLGQEADEACGRSQTSHDGVFRELSRDWLARLGDGRHEEDRGNGVGVDARL